MHRKVSILVLIVLFTIVRPALAQDETPLEAENTIEPAADLVLTDEAPATLEVTLPAETPTAEATETPQATPTPQPTPLMLDAQLDAFQTELERAQPEYFAITGRYLQVLPTTSDDLTLKPTDGALSPAEVGLVINFDSTIQFAVDEYDGPYGAGYVVRLWQNLDGFLYEKDIHYGPDPAFDSFEWQLVDETI